jgi:class 3 adenylate cyclase
LILFGAEPRYAWAPDYPLGTTEAQHRRDLEEIDDAWGTRAYSEKQVREWGAPSRVDDAELVTWLMGYLRRAASPGAAMALERMNYQIDVRHVLPAVHVPTLVLARTGDPDFPVEATREMAKTIPTARLVEFPGADNFFWIGDQAAILGEVERFVEDLGEQQAELERVLATVLFTDIVGSTERAAEFGDQRGRKVLEAHHAMIRSLIARYRGREIDAVGDSSLATFDGPIRAIRCALAIRDRVADLGLEIRAGLHTGEIELAAENVRGIAVHIGARVAGLAGPSEVLVSSTVKDLVAGAALEFEDRGEHSLKGVPGVWRVYRVISTSTNRGGVE